MRAIEFLTEGDKMSNINLDQALANTPPVWKKFISSLPPQLAREFVDERPVPNQEDIDWFTPLRLKNPQPVAVSVADLLRHPENQGSIGRSPDDVIDAVNQQWGLRIPSGKKYDPNPARYRAYAQMTPGTASPSVAVDGVIIFGAGRFVAASLRGDKTMRVWDMTRKQGVAEGNFDSFKFGKPITFTAYHSSDSKIKRILPADEFYFSDDRYTWEGNYLYKIKITLKNPYVVLDQKAGYEGHASDSLPKIKAAGYDGVIYTPYSVDYGFRQGVCFYPQRQISNIKLVNSDSGE
jgi:hypothetical protein